MQIIVQFYVLFTLVCMLLFNSMREVMSNKLLQSLLFLVIYSGTIQVIEDVYPHLPLFFSITAFLGQAVFIPGLYLALRNNFYAVRLHKNDAVHLSPFFILLIGCLFANSLYGNMELLLKGDWNAIEAGAKNSLPALCFYSFGYCFTIFYLWKVLMMIRYKLETNKLIAKDAVPSEQAAGSLPVQDGHSHPVSLSMEKTREMNETIIQLLNEKKPYLQQRYSLKDLSEDTNIPLHHLSAFINKHCGKNFNDFINEYRIEYCKTKILNQEYKYKKLEAIAGESGFNNRNTFAIAFKKFTGLNPSEFLKKMKTGKIISANNYGMSQTA